MAELSSLTARAIKTGLKRGYDLDDFCKKYNVDRVTLMWHLRTKVYPYGDQAGKTLRQMESNAKKKRKGRAVKVVGGERRDNVVKLEDGTTMMYTQSMPLSELPKLQKEYNDLIAELTEQLNCTYEDNLAKIAEFESEYSELTKTRCSEGEALERLDAEIAELKKALQAKSSERTRAMLSVDRLDRSINAVVKKRDELSADTDEIQRHLSELSTLEAFCAFSDGSVTSLEGLDVSVDADTIKHLQQAVKALSK